MRKQKSILFTLFMGLMIVSIILGSHTFVRAGESGAQNEQKVLVPNFSLLTYDNQTIRLNDYRGKVVVLNFWASWCAPCRSEMDELQDLHDQLQAGEEAVLLLLNQIDGHYESVQSGVGFLAENDYTMTNLLDHGLVGTQMFGVTHLPTTVIVDAEGYISSYVFGPVQRTSVLKMIEEAF